MWAFLAAGIGRWLAGGAIFVLIIGGIYWKGRNDGGSACELRQQAQMDKMEKYVKTVRERIEHKLSPDDVDAIMRSDAFER